MRLVDKVAVITGAGRGIGEAIASTFAAEGASVAVLDISEVDAGKVAGEIQSAGGRALAYRVDVRDRQQVAEAAEAVAGALGPADILVNNAGINRDSLMMKMTGEQWDEVMEVNLKGYFNCAQAFAAQMIPRGTGKIVNISSRSALGNFGQTNYSASKAGVIGLTRAMALELARYNINVNSIAPGFIDTEMTRKMPEDARERFLKAIPLARAGGTRDVAAAALFLASEEASYITGQVLFVCGGRSIGAAPL